MAVSRGKMLGHYRRGCISYKCCQCGGGGDTTRWRKRVEAREVEREIDQEIREGLAAAGRGETVDLGSFAQYADDVPSPCWCCGDECMFCDGPPESCTPDGPHWCEPCKYGGKLDGCYCGSAAARGRPQDDPVPPPAPLDPRWLRNPPSSVPHSAP